MENKEYSEKIINLFCGSNNISADERGLIEKVLSLGSEFNVEELIKIIENEDWLHFSHSFWKQAIQT